MVLLRGVAPAAVVAAVAAAQLIDPEQGEPHRKSQQNDSIGSAHSHLAASAVLLVGQPVLHLLLCFLNCFLVHAGVTLFFCPIRKNVYCLLDYRSSSALMKGAVGDLARESWRTVPWAVMVPPVSGIVRSSRLHCFKTIRQNAFADFRRAGAM